MGLIQIWLINDGPTDSTGMYQRAINVANKNPNKVVSSTLLDLTRSDTKNFFDVNNVRFRKLPTTLFIIPSEEAGKMKVLSRVEGKASEQQLQSVLNMLPEVKTDEQASQAQTFNETIVEGDGEKLSMGFGGLFNSATFPWALLLVAFVILADD